MIVLHKKEFPNKYIGSKSNCTLKEGKIYDCRKKEYVGSSKNKLYMSDISKYAYTVYVLGEFNNYNECITHERNCHIINDVVANTEYYNLSIATENNFGNPNYATYKHTITEKKARLPRNHEKVLSGEWIGITKGRTMPEKQKKLCSFPGKLNPFYGKTHSPETRKILSELAAKTFKGKPKTKEHKEKIRKALLGKKKTKEHIENLKMAQRKYHENKIN